MGRAWVRLLLNVVRDIVPAFDAREVETSLCTLQALQVSLLVFVRNRCGWAGMKLNSTQTM